MSNDEPMYRLHARQMDAFKRIWDDDVEQLVYGGAAGGGKSHFARALAYHLAMQWPGARIAIFRKNATQLEKTHVPAWRREMDAGGYDVNSPKTWNATANEFRLPNGSVVEFLHIDQAIGAEKWLSAEWAALIVDEATQMEETDLKLLYSRVRATDEQKHIWPRWRPLALYCTNPGGISHSYFYNDFVVPGQKHGLEPWTHSEEVNVNGRTIETNIRRCFMPAFLTDNPSLDSNQYTAGLAQIGGVRAQQMLSGDWEAFEGKVFDQLDPETHYVDARWVFNGDLVPPKEWPRIIGLDHGTANPTAVNWTCRDEDGFFITYLEYYSPGPVGKHIAAVKDLMLQDGRLDLVPESDPRMWHKTKGTDRLWSVADEYRFAGEPPTSKNEMLHAQANGVLLHKATITREASKLSLHRLHEPDDSRVYPDWHPRAGQYGAPRWFIAYQCPEAWRELNGIQIDPNNPEETIKADDHAYDALGRSVPLLEQRLISHRSRGPRRVLATR